MWQAVAGCLRKESMLNASTEEVQCLRSEALVHGTHSVGGLFSAESHTCAQTLAGWARGAALAAGCSLARYGAVALGKDPSACQEHLRGERLQWSVLRWSGGGRVEYPSRWICDTLDEEIVWFLQAYFVLFLRAWRYWNAKCLALARLMNDLQVSFINFHLLACTEKYCLFHWLSGWEIIPFLTENKHIHCEENNK